MQHIKFVFGWIKESWGSVSQLILGLLALILALRPKAFAQLEEKALWKVAAPLLVGIVAISGFVLSQKGDNELRSQVRFLFTQTQASLSKTDMDSVIAHIDLGFGKLASRLSGIPKSSLAPRGEHAQQHSSRAVEPILPAPPHVTFTQSRGVSTDPEFPFALNVTIQSDQPVPVSFAINCSGELGKIGKFLLVGQGVYFSVAYGVTGTRAQIRFGYPPLTPQSPLVVTILSKKDVRVIGIEAM